MSAEKRFSDVRNIRDFFDTGKELGQGAFSIVREGKNKKTGETVAIKCIAKKHIKVHLLEREIEIMKRMQHPNVLHLKDVFEDTDTIFLVLDLVRGGELFAKIIDKGNYSEEDTRKIIRQVLEAVAYLHEQGVAHRDLKPENLLCGEADQELHIRVADFGLSRMFGEDEAMETQCGSLEYTAPEVLSGAGYGKSCDLWSIGVIAFVLLTGCFPFFTDDSDVGKLYKKIQDVDYNWKDAPKGLSAAAKHFISHLLVRDPTKRLSTKQALEHPWIQGAAHTMPLSQSFTNLLELPKATKKFSK